MFNYTHLPISVAAVLIFDALGYSPWAAVLITSTYWISREVTQAEYRWIERLGTGKRASMPWWGGYDPRAWTFKSAVMDMLLPVMAGCGLAYYLVGAPVWAY